MTTPAAPLGGERFHHNTRRWKALAAATRADAVRLGTPCCYCAEPLDFEAATNDPRAYTTAHWLSVRDHPHLAEDPRNIRGPAHRSCNSRAGADSGPLPLGPLSHDW